MDKVTPELTAHSALTEESLIDGLRSEWPEVLDRHFPDYPSHCILATRTAIEVARYFGHEWVDLEVDVAVFNGPGWRSHVDGLPLDQWPPEAWSVGAVYDEERPAEGYPGHVIVGTESHVLDLSIGQFSRPERGIEFEPTWFAPRPPLVMGSWAWVERGTVGVTLILTPRPEVDVYRTSPDWRVNYKRLAADLIRRLRPT